jgi:asparagine synthase (glutamine-hydrolysing)
MCGIVGFVDPGGRVVDPERVIGAMTEALSHRGPDDSGTVVAAPLFAGHRRLTIVDTSESGRQPFVERAGDGAVELVAWANGEIYNHSAIRDRIREIWPGVQVPPSDCAVLPYAWRMERQGAPEILEGMFALAIWDARSGELLLARDPAGQKPLFYAEFPGGGLAFASEIKALLHHPLVSRDIDPVGLRRYLAFETISGPATIYGAIRRLGPGERLLLSDGRVRVERYADLTPVGPAFESIEASSAALLEALEASCRSRLMSDVPLGIWLSGGLDSAAIAAVLAGDRLPAFSMGFDDSAFDESPAAQAVASRLELPHHLFRASSDGVTDHIEAVLAHMDEPFADPSILPTSLLARETAKEVKVVLGGDGGDELLLGYPTFYAERWAGLAARLPSVLRSGVLGAAARLLPVSSGYMSLDFKVRRFLMGLAHPPARRHSVWIGGVDPADHPAALAKPWRELASDEEVFAHVDAIARRIGDARPDAPLLERLAWVYQQTYLADGVLTKVDRASMAHGLEVRAPFLDARVQRVCARIPLHHKLQGSVTKRVLRHGLRGRLPDSVLQRAKRGFAVPVAAWLRGPLQPWMRSALAPERVRSQGLLDPAWTTRLIDEHCAGKANHRKALWSALMLTRWYDGPHGPGAGSSP